VHPKTCLFRGPLPLLGALCPRLSYGPLATAWKGSRRGMTRVVAGAWARGSRHCPDVSDDDATARMGKR
jgi:hypothetical protein